MYGFLRETENQAIKGGLDKDTGIGLTGLDTYLQILFPSLNWVHDEICNPPIIKSNGSTSRVRPDYQYSKVKVAINFDGLPHYQNPDIILKDYQQYFLYKQNGWKLIRIPYFIQLTKSACDILFSGITGYNSPEKELFPENIPSIGLYNKCSPKYLCNQGIIRMAYEFHKFPKQYEINLENLKKLDPNNDSEYKTLEYYYKANINLLEYLNINISNLDINEVKSKMMNLVWINDGKEELRVPIYSISEYLLKGYKKGRLCTPNTNLIWINDGNHQKMVTENELLKYLSNGWNKGLITGTIKGRKILHNIHTNEIRIEKDEKIIQELLDSKEWNLGRGKGKIHIHNPQTKENKMIFKDELDTYISQGWIKGRGKFTSNSFWINNGSENKRVKEEEIEDYTNIGWKRGKLNRKNT